VNELNRVLSRSRAQNDPKLMAILINQFYVDEVQDLTMAQILPLLKVCKDPANGLMFSGDTAQVITRGSVFRFEDLKTMIYHTLQETNVEKRAEIFYLTKNCKIYFMFYT
jgi:superfamily I DNA/RNA helicase